MQGDRGLVSLSSTLFTQGSFESAISLYADRKKCLSPWEHADNHAPPLGPAGLSQATQNPRLISFSILKLCPQPRWTSLLRAE